jgi:ATP-dependent HslUV protease ATP-binding subunit HslU
LEDISFNAPTMKGQTVTINHDMVRELVHNLMKRSDLSKFVL